MPPGLRLIATRPISHHSAQQHLLRASTSGRIQTLAPPVSLCDCVLLSNRAAGLLCAQRHETSHMQAIASLLRMSMLCWNIFRQSVAYLRGRTTFKKSGYQVEDEHVAGPSFRHFISPFVCARQLGCMSAKIVGRVLASHSFKAGSH